LQDDVKRGAGDTHSADSFPAESRRIVNSAGGIIVDVVQVRLERRI